MLKISRRRKKCGGYTPPRKPDPAIDSMVCSLRPQVEARLGQFAQFKAVQYTSQVVNGVNYQIWVDVGGPQIRLHVYRPIHGPPEVTILNAH